MSEQDHDHPHAEITNGDEPPAARRARTLEELLVAKHVVRREDVRRMIDWLVSRSPADGARLVARAWTDPEFKQRLLADARAAALELGLDPGPSPVVVAVENTRGVHHMVVCTLCSCYPRALLGPPPDWYKSLAYRSRAVSDPRGVLAEFGVELDDDVELRVLDSTADMRYLVIPRRPAGTEQMDEAELAALVTRDSMIGVAHPAAPARDGGGPTTPATPGPRSDRVR
ncbi:MAG: nitrile hydratase subunit alpha [Solirubrobacterales bacterium]|nr:nitrile hydratase subunit alpha [Solirubrobacterales bacterium]MBV9423625.1 nitrile hydratase subunit alpha [Solirubrobacterales bacterium]MBV9800345.1 nitrile hydratase subunit alpha [Solirubrobacterales bacterium]